MANNNGTVKWSISLNAGELLCIEWIRKNAGLNGPREAIRYALKRASHEMGYPGAVYLNPVRQRGRPRNGGGGDASKS